MYTHPSKNGFQIFFFVLLLHDFSPRVSRRSLCLWTRPVQRSCGLIKTPVSTPTRRLFRGAVELWIFFMTVVISSGPQSRKANETDKDKKGLEARADSIGSGRAIPIKQVRLPVGVGAARVSCGRP